MSENILHDQRKTWFKKPVTRAIYEDFYQRIITFSSRGRSLEIGGGSGNLKDYYNEVVSTDIVFMSWIDAVADAQALPFHANSFANIVAVDVLHHIENPRQFFVEAGKVLQPGGRIILIEPSITPVSWFFYQFFHPEPVILHDNPMIDKPVDMHRRPFDANQAIPTLLFRKYRQSFEKTFPELKIVKLEWMSLFAYPLSGGFRPWSLIPASSIGFFLRIERMLAPFIGWLTAFRLFIVIEKK